MRIHIVLLLAMTILVFIGTVLANLNRMRRTFRFLTKKLLATNILGVIDRKGKRQVQLYGSFILADRKAGKSVDSIT